MILSLFGSASNEAKRVIADKLRLLPHPEEFRRGKSVLRQRIDENTNVVDLVGPDSRFIFEALSMDYDRLSKPVTTLEHVELLPRNGVDCKDRKSCK